MFNIGRVTEVYKHVSLIPIGPLTREAPVLTCVGAGYMSLLDGVERHEVSIADANSGVNGWSQAGGFPAP